MTTALTTPWTDEVGPRNALPEYPRPQLARPSAARPTWLNLNGEWEFETTDGIAAVPLGRPLSGRILVPYPVESALSGVEQRADHVVYRREVDVPRAWRTGGKRVRLHFGAVHHDATIFVNGEQVGRHLGGYESFSIDVTAALVKHGPQEVVVAVHAPVDGENVLVGKQRREPEGIFYTASSGIWQTVWLEPVPAASIASLVAVPDIDAGTFTVTTTLHGRPRKGRLTVEVLAGRRMVATASGAPDGPLAVRVRKPRLWSPDDPFLYTVRARLEADGSVDRVEASVGMRSIAIEEVGGVQRITLNHEPAFLLSTLDQGFWPDGLHTAPTDAALRFDVERTKALGFNTIRKHIKVEPARWYHWADRLGLLVWQDIPSLPIDTELTESDRTRFLADTARIVEQLRGVTSIIGWVPFNEGWGQWSIEAAADAADRVKAQDPTRLVIARSGANCCHMPGDAGNGDVIDWHEYQGPALPSPDASRAAIDGEHGGLTLPIEGHSWAGADVNPYGAVADSAALTEGYVANTTVLLERGVPGGLSGAVYTQITDVEGEQNGLLTYDRRVEKVDVAAVRAINERVIEAGARR